MRTGASGRVEYVPNAFWAESVSNAFSRALLYRTGARLGTTHAIAFPWYSTTRVDWKVPVDVLRFEATEDGKAMLVARWSVESTANGSVSGATESSFEETAGTDPGAIVDAMSRCIDRFAETIAAAVAGAADSATSRSPARRPRPATPAAAATGSPGAASGSGSTGSNALPPSPAR